MRNRQFLLLALVFLGPVGVAAIAYFGPWEWAPRAAHGQLIDPPVQLPPLRWLSSEDADTESAGTPRKWLLVYARLGACAADCEGALARLGQVWLALSGDGDRVDLVALLSMPGPGPAAGWRSAELESRTLTALDSAVGRDSLEAGRVLVVDPLGNVVTAYPADVAQQDLFDDLERLLEWSRIG